MLALVQLFACIGKDSKSKKKKSLSAKSLLGPDSSTMPPISSHGGFTISAYVVNTREMQSEYVKVKPAARANRSEETPTTFCEVKSKPPLERDGGCKFYKAAKPEASANKFEETPTPSCEVKSKPPLEQDDSCKYYKVEHPVVKLINKTMEVSGRCAHCATTSDSLAMEEVSATLDEAGNNQSMELMVTPPESKSDVTAAENLTTAIESSPVETKVIAKNMDVTDLSGGDVKTAMATPILSQAEPRKRVSAKEIQKGVPIHKGRKKASVKKSKKAKSWEKPTTQKAPQPGRSKSLTQQRIPTVPPSRVATKFWDSGGLRHMVDLEDDSMSTRQFARNMSKSSDTRLAWMERTLSKGVGYQVRKFSANRQYVAPYTTTKVSDANPRKNRYADIKCIDVTRVILRDAPSDYINANYIVALTGRKFICTQAPMDSTKEDFWRMIVQEHCRVIVMLCSGIEENGKNGKKCAAYYPACVGDTVVIGKTKIISEKQFVSGRLGYTVSICDVQHGISRFKLSHIHCISWPDHSAPEGTECVIAIHKMLLKNHIGRPIVVHCSAGIGRTCTLVGIELMLERVLLRRNPSPISVVRLMRRCRMGAIQASVQFVFMQLVLLELFCQDGLMDVSDPRMVRFRNAYLRLLKRYNERMNCQRNAGRRKASNRRAAEKS